MIRRKARLLCTALSISIAVVAAGVVGLDSASGVVPPSISANPTTITAGTSTKVTWDKIVSPTVKDWIGLYGSPQSPDANFFAFRYTDSVFGISVSQPFNVPLGTPPGNQFQFRLFSNDTFTRLATSGPIIINAPAFAMTQSRGSVQGNGAGTQIVSWASIPAPTTKDWIGLYASSGAADTAFLAFRYTDSTTVNGNEPFTIPAGTPPGSGYRFRIFSNDTFTRLGQGGGFNVT